MSVNDQWPVAADLLYGPRTCDCLPNMVCNECITRPGGVDVCEPVGCKPIGEIRLNRRPGRDEYFLQMLGLVASRATCARGANGAIITSADGHVLAMGYNGGPRGLPHCLDSPCAGATDAPGDYSRCEAIHAETNAIQQCRSLQEAAVIYVTRTPCFQCAKQIANSPIKRVVVAFSHPRQEGAALLRRCGIEVIHHAR